MIKNMLTYASIYIYLKCQNFGTRIQQAYSKAKLNEYNAFSSHIRYPFIHTERMNEPESYFQVPMSQFTVLTHEPTSIKVEFLDNIVDIDGLPKTYQAWPDGSFKAKRKLVNRTQDFYYWN